MKQRGLTHNTDCISQVTRPVDASKVKCYGPGVDRINPLYSKTPQEFTVDTSEAGDADLEVTVETPNRKILKPEPVCEKGDGVYTVDYTPEDEGEIRTFIGVWLLLLLYMYFFAAVVPLFLAKQNHLS